MHCPAEEELWELLDSAASEVETPLREHAASCAACAARLDELRSLHQGLERIGTTPELPVPESIGSYRIERVIGQGSGGIVYEAEQAEPRRRVALKVLRQAEGSSHRALRAFRREIRALARFDHPSIASIHDAGRSDDGRVYFAMQLVRGRPLDRYCEEEALSVRERARLVISVADAVHYAHQRGVLHRDLKPANILVDGEGRPVVLDFGLALALSRDCGWTMSVGASPVVGTLLYMSPEQVEGEEEMDGRSDVYSLGVNLYVLLTGRAPYDVRAGFERARTTILEASPPHPSRVNPRVPRELGDVVMKALAKDRWHRYTSAEGFARDLASFLSGEAVEARPTSASYRLRVFARRNKPAAFGIAGIFIVLVAGILANSAALRRSRQQEAETLLVAGFMSEMLRNLDKQAGVARPSRDVLDEIASRLDQEQHLFARDSLAEAMLRESIGVAYLGERDLEAAIPQLDRALELHESLLAGDEPRVVRSRYLAGLAHFRAMDMATVGRLLEENRRLHATGVLPDSVELAASLALLVEADVQTLTPGELKVLRAPVDGEFLLAEPLRMLRGLPPSRDRDREEAAMLHAAALMSSELDDKIRLARRTLGLCEQLEGTSTWDVLDPLASLATCLLARSRTWDGTERDVEEAVELLVRRVEVVRELYGPGVELAESYQRLADAQLVVSPSEALRGYERAFELEQAPMLRPYPTWAFQDRSGTSDPAVARAVFLACRADALQRAGVEGAAAAKTALEEEISRLEEGWIGDPQARLAMWDALLRCALARGCPAEAASYRREASSLRAQRGIDLELTLTQRIEAIRPEDTRPVEAIVAEILPDGVPAWGPPRGPIDPPTAIPVRVALHRVHAGHPVDLQELRGLVATVTERNEGFFSMDVSEARWALGLALIDAGELGEAEEVLSEAAAYYNVWDDLEDAISRWAHARALWASGQYEEAREELRAIYTIYPSESWVWYLILLETALAHLGTEEHQQALGWLDQALPRLSAELGQEHRYVQEAGRRMPQGGGPGGAPNTGQAAASGR